MLERALGDSIDEALREILSDKVKEAFLKYFEASFHVLKGDVPNHIEDFVKALSDIFGPLGSLVLGRAIARRLYLKLDLQFVDESNRTLLDYLKQAEMDSRRIHVP